MALAPHAAPFNPSSTPLPPFLFTECPSSSSPLQPSLLFIFSGYNCQAFVKNYLPPLLYSGEAASPRGPFETLGGGVRLYKRGGVPGEVGGLEGKGVDGS